MVRDDVRIPPQWNYFDTDVVVTKRGAAYTLPFIVTPDGCGATTAAAAPLPYLILVKRSHLIPTRDDGFTGKFIRVY
jgi:hypothetical protein